MSSFLGSKMMPYSTAFIDEILGVADNNSDTDGDESQIQEPKKKSSIQPLKMGVVDEDFFNLVSIPHTFKSNHSTLIELSRKLTFYISGFCYITLLKGKLSVNGFSLVVGTKHRINCPVWQPAVRAFATPLTSKKIQFNLLQLICGDAAGTFVTECGDFLSRPSTHCVFLVEEIPRAQQSWLIAAEDQSLYSDAHINTRQSIDRTKKSKTVASADSSIADVNRPFQLLKQSLAGVGSAMIGSLDHFVSMGIDVMNLPASWVNGVDGLVAEVAHKEKTRTVVCGAKGVGKSACLRHTVNSLLSQSEVGAVCVIDCDLGQPELTVPGLISLHVVRTPLLSAAHLNLDSAIVELSFFVGDITSRHEPELLVAFLKELVARYEELSAECEREHRSVEAKLASNSSGNNFHALLLDDQTHGVPNDTKRGVMRKSGDLRPAKVLPLVVNTDGFVRYMGAEVLVAVMACVAPTHVLHISTEKDRDLPALQRLPVDCVLSALEAGRVSAPKVTAVDLRTLRLVAHFLGDHQGLKARIRGGTDKTTVDTSCADGAQRRDVECAGLYIRNGAIVDPDGAIALALLALPPMLVPFECAAIHSLSADVPPCLLLAAANASLVGLAPCGPRTPPTTTHVLSSSGSTGEGCDDDQERFELSCAVGPVFSYCAGVALVRAVDQQQRCFVVTLPQSVATACVPSQRQSTTNSRYATSAVQQHERLSIIRSSHSLHLPNVMHFAPGFPCFPYLSSESAGEGSAKMRARNNLKRRSQQQR